MHQKNNTKIRACFSNLLLLVFKNYVKQIKFFAIKELCLHRAKDLKKVRKIHPVCRCKSSYPVGCTVKDHKMLNQELRGCNCITYRKRLTFIL